MREINYFYFKRYKCHDDQRERQVYIGREKSKLIRLKGKEKSLKIEEKRIEGIYEPSWAGSLPIALIIVNGRNGMVAKMNR